MSLDAHAVLILGDLDLDVAIDAAEGETVAVLGPNGAGKTTLLRALAGLVPLEAGRVVIDDVVVDDPAQGVFVVPERRSIGVVFQNYLLFPHLSVLENVAFGLRSRRVPRSEARRRSGEWLDRLGLADRAGSKPGALSGGQQQRVALARALVIGPPLLMFDEPLSNLDAKLRIDMRVEIRQLQRANGTTSVYVTHDQEEAFSISDRVAIMNAGRIMQFDAPETLYQRPANAFVARFVGFENLVPMRVVSRDGETVRAEAPGGAVLALPLDRFGPVSEAFLLGARADGLVVSAEPAAEGIPATLGLRTYLGRAYQYQCETAAGALVANGPLSQPLEPGSPAKLVPAWDQCCVLGAE